MLLTNAHIITADADFRGAVEVLDGKITRVFRDTDTLPNDAETVDCGDNYLMPGFIDIHTHGAMGYHWDDAKIEGNEAIAKYKLTEGVTTVLPSTASLPHEELKKAHAALRDYVGKSEYGPKIPGIHMEGCYFNPNMRVAHYLPYIRQVSVEEILELHAIYPLARISLATEMSGMDEAIPQIVAAGIKVGAGHSSATFEQLKHAMTLGVDQLCHFCNQMSPLRHRAIGMVGAGLLLNDLFVEAIGDKVHLCADMLALIAKCVPKDKLVLITDAISGAGLPDATYKLGGIEIEIKNGIAYVAGTNTLGGGTTPYNVIFRNFVEISGWPLADAIKAATINPATAIGLPDVGKIEPGYCADLAILDKDFNVLRAFVDGK